MTSSPTYAQSNGKAEQAVKSAKRLMKRTKRSKQGVYLSILDFRNTPSEGMSSSPAQRLMSRRTKTRLPTTRSLLKPEIAKSVSSEIRHNKDLQCKYYNRTAKDLPELKPGQEVWLAPKQNDRTQTWTKGTVNQKVNIRSYEVHSEAGRNLRRNRKDIRIRKSKADAHATSDAYIDTKAYDGDATVNRNPWNTRHQASPVRTSNATRNSVSRSTDDSGVGTSDTNARDTPVAPSPIQTQIFTRTRSGRQVKFPQKFQDFDTA